VNSQRLNSYGIPLVLISGVLWGTVGIATKSIYLVSDIDALTVGFFRLAIAFPFVFLFSICFLKKERKKFILKDFGIISLLGALLAIYQVFYFASIGYVGVSIATVITLCSAPVIVSLLSILILKEPITVKISFSLLLALVGTALIVGIQNFDGSQQDTLFGTLLALGSAIGYATVTLLGRSLSQNYHPLQTTSVAFGMGAVCLLPFSSLSSIATTSHFSEVIMLLLYIGLIPSALAYTTFFLGMRSVIAPIASILTMVEPLTAAILAWLFYGENLKLSGYFGATLMIFAVISICVNNTPPRTIESLP